MDKERDRELLKRAGGVEDRDEDLEEGRNVIEPELYNGTSNTAAGITTPGDQQDIGSTDSLSEVVEGTMDNIRKAFTKDEHIDDRKH